MAYIMEQAGGAALIGGERALDIQPTSLHDRVPIVMGSKQDVAQYEKFYAESKAVRAGARDGKTDGAAKDNKIAATSVRRNEVA